MVEEEEVMETDLEDEEMTTTAVADLVVAEARIGRGSGAVVGGERGARAGLEAATGEEDQGEGTTKTPTATETTTVLVTVEQEDMGMVAGGEGEEEVVGVEGAEDLTGAVRTTGLKGRADGEMKVMIRRKEELRLTRTTRTVETMPNPSWRTLTLVLRLQATRSRIV